MGMQDGAQIIAFGVFISAQADKSPLSSGAKRIQSDTDTDKEEKPRTQSRPLGSPQQGWTWRVPLLVGCLSRFRLAAGGAD